MSERYRLEEREMIARLQAALRSLCERCRITPEFPAFECAIHNQWCHESGVDGWGHYRCALGARAELLAPYSGISTDTLPPSWQDAKNP